MAFEVLIGVLARSPIVTAVKQVGDSQPRILYKVYPDPEVFGDDMSPLTPKGKKIKKAMKKTYGKKGERVFYKSQKKGTIKGTH